MRTIRKTSITLAEAEKLKTMMERVATWLRSLPREELTHLAVYADKESEVMLALREFIERLLSCNEAIVGRIACGVLETLSDRKKPRKLTKATKPKAKAAAKKRAK